jgi:hypothetical protein
MAAHAELRDVIDGPLFLGLARCEGRLSEPASNMMDMLSPHSFLSFPKIASERN